MNLAAIEMDSGGILANILTNITENSKFFKYGIVISRNELKAECNIGDDLIGQFGIASKEIAGEMAIAAKRKYGTSVGVGLIGVMELGDPINSLGTIFIGIDNGKGPQTFKRNYPGTRLQIKQRAAVSALFELRKILR
jgi:nicotinamide-nucleotide amidase